MRAPGRKAVGWSLHGKWLFAPAGFLLFACAGFNMEFSGERLGGTQAAADVLPRNATQRQGAPGAAMNCNKETVDPPRGDGISAEWRRESTIYDLRFTSGGEGVMRGENGAKGRKPGGNEQPRIDANKREWNGGPPCSMRSMECDCLQAGAFALA